MKPTDLAYAAGLIDGEGYIGIKKFKAYKCQGRVTPGYQPRIQVRMVDEAAIKWLAQLFGGWYYPEKPHCNKGRPLFCYQASDTSALRVVVAIAPYLKIKQQQVALLLTLARVKKRKKIKRLAHIQNSRWGQPMKTWRRVVAPETLAKMEKLWIACRNLNGWVRHPRKIP